MQNIQIPCEVKQIEIKQLSNRELLSQTKILVQKERNLHIRVLHHLREIESRKLYFSQGFSSLFDYAVKELGYSEGAAYRRIKAMKLCRDIPETESRLQSGRLSLSSACQLQSFFEKQDKKIKVEKSSYEILKQTDNVHQEESLKISGKSGFSNDVQPVGASEDIFSQNSQNGLKDSLFPSATLMGDKPKGLLSVRQKQDLVEKAEGCSTRETARLLSEVDPSLSVPREQARFLGNGRVEIKVVIDEDCHKKIEELRNLLSHRNPALSYGGLFTILVEEGLKKHDPRRKGIGKQNLKTGNIQVCETSARKWGKTGNAQAVVATSAQKWEKTGNVSATSAQKLVQTDNILAVAVTSAPEKPIVSSDKKPDTSKPHYRKLNRAIPAGIRRDVWTRDQGQCAYVHPNTGKRCASRYLLQVDHIKPLALGGGSQRENLRLLCAGHNRFRSEKTFSGK